MFMNVLFAEERGISHTTTRRGLDPKTNLNAEAATVSVMPRGLARRLTRSLRVEAKTGKGGEKGDKGGGKGGKHGKAGKATGSSGPIQGVTTAGVKNIKVKCAKGRGR